MIRLLRRTSGRSALGRRFVAEILRERTWDERPLDTPAGRRLLEQPDDVQISALFAALERMRPRGNVYDDSMLSAGTLASQLARRKLAYSAADVEDLVRSALDEREEWLRGDRLRAAVSAAEFFVRERGLEPVEKTLRRARDWVELEHDELYRSERTALAKRLRTLLETEPPREIDRRLLGADNWGKAAARILEPHRRDAPTAALLVHAASLTQARPSQKWRDAATEPVGVDGVLRELLEAALTAEPFTQRYIGVPEWLSDKSADLLRGLLYVAAARRSPWLADLAARLALHAGATVGEMGELRNQKVANACARVLGGLGGDDAVAQLTVLEARIKHRAVRKQIDAALAEAAAAAGLSKSQLVERRVPTLGLDADGRREVVLGDATAILEHGELTWRNGDGKRLKSVPERVREEHADELRAVRAEAKEVKKRLAVERLRIESLFGEARRWDVAEWRGSYRDHPLVGAIARPLLWQFLADGRTEVALGADAPAWAEQVELWHPIGAEPEEVQHWRRFLLERELTQPFKQAFRELYAVAPAELETRTYSNRFAAHILRYPQAYALVKQRGWGVTALGPYDNGGGRQWRDFEHFGLRAHFWMDHADDDWDGEGMLDRYAATDQVRFTRIDDREDEPVPLADIPRVVFSETMRDVDLFVGVTSIAADPEWIDHGEARYRDYWHAASFGQLSETAETRRQALAELIPQLAIADRLELTERFLVVRGDRRTYRIHLGSANILMEPDDQYLCIVPLRSGPKLYLPFPDDERLAVILSKAFLLARDSKIDDPTIAQQLQRR